MTYARSPETRKVASSGFRVNGLTSGCSLRSIPAESRTTFTAPAFGSKRRSDASWTRPSWPMPPSPSSLSLTGAAAIVRAVVAARSAASVEMGGSTLWSWTSKDGRPASAVSRSEARTASSSIAVPSRPGTTTASFPSMDTRAETARFVSAASSSASAARPDSWTRSTGCTSRCTANGTASAPRRAETRFACGVVRGPLARRAVNLEDVGRRHPQRLASDHDLDRLVQPRAELGVDARPRVGRREAADVDSGHRDAGQHRVPQRVRAGENRNSGHRDHQRRHEEHRARSPETLDGARKACGDLGHGPRRLAANAAYHHAKCSKRILYGHCPR